MGALPHDPLIQANKKPGLSAGLFSRVRPTATIGPRSYILLSIRELSLELDAPTPTVPLDAGPCIGSGRRMIKRRCLAPPGRLAPATPAARPPPPASAAEPQATIAMMTKQVIFQKPIWRRP